MNMKMILAVPFLLACSMPALAQSNMSDSSIKGDQMAGKKMSMTGCVSEKDGKYILTNKEHPDGVQLMSSKDLKAHVGHTIKVTGTMGKMDGTSGDSMKSDDSMKSNDNMKSDKMKKDNMGMQLEVSSMKMVSDHCEMPDTMNK